MKSSRTKEQSKNIAEKENQPNITVPQRIGPSTKAPPRDNESKTQVKRKEETFRYDCEPDGYPTVVLDEEGYNMDIAKDPYFYKGDVEPSISMRSGVLGHGSGWANEAERSAMWRQQHSLRDMRYYKPFVDPHQTDVSNYYNAKPIKRDPALKKKGPYQQYINGISYIPKSLIIRDQPAVNLFSSAESDPNRPSMEDLENDRKDPYYQTVANSLENTRSYKVRTQIGNELLQTRNAVNKLNNIRMIRVTAPYGEGLGKSWFKKIPQTSNDIPQPPHNLGKHNVNVMKNGLGYARQSI